MELPYDGDTQDASQYCEHGTFIGSWWGPDYMCGWCEDGISVEEMHAIKAANKIHAAERKLAEGERIMNVVVNVMTEQRIPYNVQLAQGMVDCFLDPLGGYTQAFDLVNA